MIGSSPHVHTKNWLAGSGAAFAGCYLLGIALTTYNQIPGLDQPLSTLPSFYDDSTNQWELLIGGILLAIAAVCIVVFVAAVVEEADEDDDNLARRIAFGSAIAFAACICVAAIALALVGGEMALRNAPQPSPDVERWLAELGYAMLLVPGMAAATAMTWSASRAGVSAQRLPQWMSYVGPLAALACVAALPIAIAWQPLWSQLALTAWVLLVASLLSRPARAEAPQTPQTETA